MKIQVLASTSPTALTAVAPVVTVEAEYGDAVVEGSALTMAHHGPRAGQKCPAAYTPQETYAALEAAGVPGADGFGHGVAPAVVCGVSHLDLDTIGGLMAVWGYKPHGVGVANIGEAFWRLAEFVDTRGPHRVPEWLAGEADHFKALGAVEALRAFWAWSAQNRGPRIGAEVTDVTSCVLECFEVIQCLMPGSQPGEWWEGGVWAADGAPEPDFDHCLAQWDRREMLLKAGAEFAAKEEALQRASFVRQEGSVVLRQSAQFTNHLYPLGANAAVVAFNSEKETVTVSFAEGAEGKHDACAIVQSLWGPLAGGHKGIAGSPRDRKMSFADAEEAFRAVIAEVAK